MPDILLKRRLPLSGEGELGSPQLGHAIQFLKSVIRVVDLHQVVRQVARLALRAIAESSTLASLHLSLTKLAVRLKCYLQPSVCQGFQCLLRCTGITHVDRLTACCTLASASNFGYFG